MPTGLNPHPMDNIGGRPPGASWAWELERAEFYSLCQGVEVTAGAEGKGDGIIKAQLYTPGVVNRNGWKIAADALDWTGYMRNPVVLYQHDDMRLPIGRTLEITMAGQGSGRVKAPVATMELDLDDELGAAVYRKFQAGYLSATSISILPLKFKELPESEQLETGSWFPMEILKADLLENSVVSIPADSGAVRRAALQQYLRRAKEAPEEQPETPSWVSRVLSQHRAG